MTTRYHTAFYEFKQNWREKLSLTFPFPFKRTVEKRETTESQKSQLNKHLSNFNINIAAPNVI